MATINGPPTIPSATDSNKILTKNTNRGFQIRKVPKISVEQERVLRDQLHEEIEQKTKACSNVVYDCSLPRLDGYEFCLKHILQDPKSAYKQCCYTYPRSGKRCVQPAPKKDVYTNFCFEHSRQTQLTITKTQCGTFRNVETNDTFLRELAHHVDDSKKNDRTGPQSNYVDPYGPTTRILSYASDDSSCIDVGEENSVDDDSMETDHLLVGWQGQDMEESDNESVDSQNEDFLKHAGIYTTEEATVITKNKMQRLQQLYVDQIHRLHSLLKQRRRTCLQNLKVEREVLAASAAAAEKAAQAAAAASGGVPLPAAASTVSNSVHSPTRLTPRQKALNRYLKHFGVEEIMHKKSADFKRTSSASNGHRSLAAIAAGAPANKCIYSEGGVKCGERGMPCTKYCRKHILEDKKQILYRACNIEKSGVTCQDAVPDVFENSSCVLHIELPPQREYTQKKYDSDENSEDECGTNEIDPSPTVDPKIEHNTNMHHLNASFGSQSSQLPATTFANDDLTHMDIVVNSFANN